MTTYLGPGDLKNRILPTGWDATELENRRLESNITIDQIATEAAGAASALSRELLTDPLYSMMYGVTTEPEVEYRVGSTNAFVRYAEYAPADEQRGKTEGHMLPREEWIYPLGWTNLFLERCRRRQIEADIQGMVDAGRNKWHKAMLTRFFKSADDSGVHKGLGTGGYSPAFAHTAGSTEVDFVPPDWGGQSFASTHEHFNNTSGATAADWDAAIVTMARHLAEHGHAPPYVLMVANEDQATIMGLSDFRERADPGIRYGGSVDIALVSDLYFGGVVTPDGLVMCTWSHRIPQYTMGLFKAYPQGNPRNSLAVFYTESHPLVIDFKQGVYRQFPIEQLLAYAEFGIGVRDRTNGVCHQMSAGSYSDPTIT